MQAQVPRGPEGFYCPLWRKSMDKVCHTCPLWTQVRGKNPQTDQEVDNWNCSLSWLPILIIEGSQMSRQTAAAVESFRNEVVKRSVSPNVYEEIVSNGGINNTKQIKSN